MPVPIARNEVQRLINDEAALLVDVLPAREYEDEHIAGAISVPLKRLDRDSTDGLEKTRPVIVY